MTQIRNLAVSSQFISACSIINRFFEQNQVKKAFCNFDEHLLAPFHSLSDAQMVLMVADFYIPTLIANAVTFQSLLQRFYLQPEILRHCQKEIDDVVGQSRLPKLDDRVK